MRSLRNRGLLGKGHVEAWLGAEDMHHIAQAFALL